MPKLYFSPGACSLSPHIVLSEIGEKFETEKVDLKTKKTAKGEDFLKVNPKGQVPTLITDEGQILTEGVAIVQYLADQHPEKNLLPKTETWERYKAIEWLNYISTEIHKGMGLLFAADRMVTQPQGNEELKKSAKEGMNKKFDYLSEHLKKNQFVLGNQFSAADAYLFTLLGWHQFLKIDLTKYPILMGYMEKIKSRPAVQATLKAEA